MIKVSCILRCNNAVCECHLLPRMPRSYCVFHPLRIGMALKSALTSARIAHNSFWQTLFLLEMYSSPRFLLTSRISDFQLCSIGIGFLGFCWNILSSLWSETRNSFTNKLLFRKTFCLSQCTIFEPLLISNKILLYLLSRTSLMSSKANWGYTPISFAMPMTLSKSLAEESEL